MLLLFCALFTVTNGMKTIVIDWKVGSSSFRNGPEVMSLHQWDALEIRCNRQEKITFYLVEQEELRRCERGMASPVMGVCDGSSNSVRTVMKAVASSDSALIWPPSTYYIIGIPTGTSMINVPHDYYCQMNMKITLTVLPRRNREDNNPTPTPLSPVFSHPLPQKSSGENIEATPLDMVPKSVPFAPKYTHPVPQYPYERKPYPLPYNGYIQQSFRGYHEDQDYVPYSNPYNPMVHRRSDRYFPPFDSEEYWAFRREYENFKRGYRRNASSLTSRSFTLCLIALSWLIFN